MPEAPAGSAHSFRGRPLRQRAHLPGEDLPDEDVLRVDASQVLHLARRDAPLPNDGHVVLDAEGLIDRQRPVHLLERRPAGQDLLRHLFERCEPHVQLHLPPLAVRLGVVPGDVHEVHRVADHPLVVHRQVVQQSVLPDDAVVARDAQQPLRGVVAADHRADGPYLLVVEASAVHAHAHAVVGLFRGDGADGPRRSPGPQRRLAVGVGRMGGVVVHPAEVVARPVLRQTGADHAFGGVEIGEAGQRGRLPLAKVGEDEPQVVLHRVAADLHLGGEGVGLARLLHALAGGVVLPAVVAAPERVALHPAGRQLGPPVRAPEGDQVRVALLSPVEGELLAHHLDGYGASGRDVL